MDSQGPAASALQLSTFTKVSSIPRNKRYPEFPVTVSLAAPGADRPVRVPVDIVAAIDISQSSRTNDPMLELEKHVLRIVIEKLGPADRLAVLPFDHEVRDKQGDAKEMATLVAMSREGSKKVKGLVEEIKYSAGGGTVLVKPVNKAQKILRERADPDRAAFIILLSDGGDRTVLEDKVWERESELKAGTPKPKSYYPVHTFGFTKHDPETLGHIAQKTNGTHYAGDIACIGDLDPFDAAFEALLRTAASRPFEAAAAAASLAAVHPGVTIKRIDAGGERKAVVSGDARASGVDVGVVGAGETPEFTVYLDVPEGDDDADVMEVLAVDGAYTQRWDGKVVNLGRSVVSVERPAPTPPKQDPEDVTPSKQDSDATPSKQDPDVTPSKPEPQDPCKPLYEIEERLKYWCKVKADLSAMDGKADASIGTKCDCHFTAVKREAALESINRGMHHDIYTAVVLAIKTRRCGEAPSDNKAEAGVATADK